MKRKKQQPADIQLTCQGCGGACGHIAKVQRRGIGKPMMRALLFLARHADRSVHHEEGKELGIRGRDNYCKLKALYGFAVDDPDRNGWWRIAEKGLAFLRGELAVQKAFYTTLKNEIVAVADPTMVTVDDVPGGPYDGPRRWEEHRKLEREEEGRCAATD